MLETRRCAPGCARYGNKIVVAGGWDGEYGEATVFQSTEILDLNTRKISKGGNLRSPRALFHIATFYNSSDLTTLALGGSSWDGDALNTIEEWNPETNMWSQIGSRLREKRSFFGLVAASKKHICSS